MVKFIIFGIPMGLKIISLKPVVSVKILEEDGTFVLQLNMILYLVKVNLLLELI
jgi:hypothetical protein